eukprot:1193114-Prorocentrum_minimum.AAC.5
MAPGARQSQRTPMDLDVDEDVALTNFNTTDALQEEEDYYTEEPYGEEDNQEFTGEDDVSHLALIYPLCRSSIQTNYGLNIRKEDLPGLSLSRSFSVDNLLQTCNGLPLDLQASWDPELTGTFPRQALSYRPPALARMPEPRAVFQVMSLPSSNPHSPILRRTNPLYPSRPWREPTDVINVITTQPSVSSVRSVVTVRLGA